MKFKAAILVEQHKPLVIDQIEIIDKLEYGQVLIRVVCSGICGSQIGEIDGVKGPDRFLPHLLGHEGGGIVEDTGPGVTRVKKGDHVVMHWMKGYGIEAPTPKYKWGNRIVNAGWVTTFNEYAVVSENRLTPIADDVGFEIAALMGCAVTTAFGVINNDAMLKIGESIAIFGVGGVGMSMVCGAHLVAAHPIIAIDRYDSKLELTKRLGATHTINTDRVDIKEEIYSITKKEGVDVAVDNTGNPRVIEMAYEVTSTTGRTILVGVPKRGDNINIYSLPLHFDKKLKGSKGGNGNPSIDIPRYLRLIKNRGLDLKEMISHYFSLDGINRAISMMREGKTIRCMITI